LDLHVSLTDRRNLSAEVYRQIREAILDGRLRTHEALPSTRELARRLHVSRNTVLLAYERLCAEGFLHSRTGAGTFVSDGIQTRSTACATASPLRPRALWDEIPEVIDMSAAEVAFDFRPGIPDVALFPLAAWRARVARHLRRGTIGSAANIGAAGHRGVRAAIARHVGVSRAVRANADDVVVTSGSQQAVDLIARVLLEPGDTVAVEDPAYPLARRAFHAHGARVVGVPVDASGLVVDAIPDTARLVYVTPSHQYPLGVAMTMARRQALLAWAKRADGVVVEDDYDSEFRYGGRPLEALQSLDDAGRVLYVGSFSKVMLPTLRMGFLVAPQPLLAAFCKAKQLADWHTAVPAQAALAHLIEDGVLAQHIRRMRRVYGERHERIVRVLVRESGGRLVPLPAAGGLHLTALLAPETDADDRTVAERAAAAGAAVFPLSPYYIAAPPRQGLIFGYGAIASDRLEEGVRVVIRCL
jgi:GntR family transcriptional regulator/MocR family aminotransferase